jgi:hypothetical protein
LNRSENSIKNHWNCSLKKKVDLNTSVDTSRTDYDTATPVETSIDTNVETPQSIDNASHDFLATPKNTNIHAQNTSIFNSLCNNPSNSTEETLDTSSPSLRDILSALKTSARKCKYIPSILRRN